MSDVASITTPTIPIMIAAVPVREPVNNNTAITTAIKNLISLSAEPIFCFIALNFCWYKCLKAKNGGQLHLLQFVQQLDLVAVEE